jgi:hypothetical protein
VIGLINSDVLVTDWRGSVWVNDCSKVFMGVKRADWARRLGGAGGVTGRGGGGVHHSGRKK